MDAVTQLAVLFPDVDSSTLDRALEAALGDPDSAAELLLSGGLGLADHQDTAATAGGDLSSSLEADLAAFAISDSEKDFLAVGAGDFLDDVDAFDGSVVSAVEVLGTFEVDLDANVEEVSPDFRGAACPQALSFDLVRDTPKLKCTARIKSPQLEEKLRGLVVAFSFGGDACFEPYECVVKAAGAGVPNEVIGTMDLCFRKSLLGVSARLGTLQPSVVVSLVAYSRRREAPESASDGVDGEASVVVLASKTWQILLHEFCEQLSARQEDDFPVNALFFGPPASGKSSLINTLFSAVSDSLQGSVAVAGGASNHVTRRFGAFVVAGVRGTTRHSTRLTVFDTWGLATRTGTATDRAPHDWNYSQENFARMLQSDMALNTEMEETEQIGQRSWRRQINCVVFCVCVDDIDEDGTQQMESLRPFVDQAQRLGRPCVGVVTMVDHMDPNFPRDSSDDSDQFSQSTIVLQHKLDVAARQLGLPSNSMLPMVSYGEQKTAKCLGLDRLAVQLMTTICDNAKRADQEHFEETC
jgi:CUE domain